MKAAVLIEAGKPLQIEQIVVFAPDRAFDRDASKFDHFACTIVHCRSAKPVSFRVAAVL